MARRFVVLALLVVLSSLLSLTPNARAQAVYGNIFGTVTDPSGAAVPGAKVTVTDLAKGTSDVATTNDTGNYSVTHLIPDTYSVRVEAQGFKVGEQKSIAVNADVSTHVNVQLQLGAVSEAVEVTGAAPELKTDRADVATVFNDTAVENLPLYNRNFTSLVLASPGTQQLGWSHASSENPQGSLQTKVNGQTFAGTGFQLDGTDNRDPILGIIVINPPLESVTEAKITSQNYDAEFGQAIAGVVASQTKSGSNAIHGSAFGFRRSDATQARDPFSQVPGKVNAITGQPIPPIPPSLYGQYGGAIGGPIKKDKIFYFGDYQATRSKLGSSFLQSVPSNLVRSTCGVPGVAICDLSEYLALSPTNVVFDPATGNADGTGRTPFGPLTVGNQVCTGNCIPNSRLSPQAIALLQQFPAPNTNGLLNNFSAGGNGVFNSDQFDIRMDDQLTSKMHLFGRYSFANYNQTGNAAFGALGGNGFAQGGFAGTSKSRDQSIASGFDYVLSDTLLTDFRFGYVRYHVNVIPNGFGTSPATAVGIPGLNISGDPFTSGQPAFFVGQSGGDGTDTGQISSTGGLSNFGYGLGVNRCNCPLVEQEDQFQFVNNWTKIRGNHQFKFGADVRFARNLRVPSDNHRSGELSFAKARTSDATLGGGVALATFLLGDVTTFKRYVSTSTTAAERQKRFFFYGQDTWRITPKLTFSYGLRWDIYRPEYVNGKGQGALLDLGTGDLRVAGFGNIGENFNVETNWHDFAPRLGLAYQITPKTVVRLGYGRSYDIGVFGSIFGHAVTQNLPVLAVQNNNPATQFSDVFNLSAGPAAPVFPAVPSDGLLPLPDTIFARARPLRMRLARLDAYNVTVQHELTKNTTFEIAYVGNQGHGFYQNNPDVNVNQASLVGFPFVSQNARRPFFSRFGWTQDISYFGNDAPNNYNSLQTKLSRRFTNGLQVLAHYTWSKSLDHDRDYFAIDPRVNYGPDDANRRHVFSVSGTYDLPFGHGRPLLSNAGRALDLLIGGFQLNTTTNISSGLPWSATYGECSSDEDTGPCRPILVGSLSTETGRYDPLNQQVPFYSPVPALATNGAINGPFQRPQVAHFGSGRNAFTGPGFWNSDISLFKNFSITERFTGQFRLEAFNAFNHVNYALPNNCVDCGGGFITATQPTHGPGIPSMRQLNFGIRFAF